MSGIHLVFPVDDQSLLWWNILSSHFKETVGCKGTVTTHTTNDHCWYEYDTSILGMSGCYQISLVPVVLWFVSSSIASWFQRYDWFYFYLVE